jgi:DNA-binding PadR family transcriptional regulator
MTTEKTQDIGRAVLNRDAMVYPALRDLIEGGYLDCRSEVEAERKQHACRLTEKGKEAYVASAKAWQQLR